VRSRRRVQITRCMHTHILRPHMCIHAQTRTPAGNAFISPSETHSSRLFQADWTKAKSPSGASDDDADTDACPHASLHMESISAHMESISTVPFGQRNALPSSSSISNEHRQTPVFTWYLFLGLASIRFMVLIASGGAAGVRRLTSCCGAACCVVRASGSDAHPGGQ